MFQRFHAMREQRDKGFTLIELLVVILIIAILAAIAIPVFLRQREKGWRSQVQSALKNAATAQESFLTASPTGDYATTEAQLVGEGFKKASDVTGLVIATNGGVDYCMEAGHNDVEAGNPALYHYDSDEGEPLPGAC